VRMISHVHLVPKLEAIPPICLHHVLTDNSAFTLLPALLVEKWHWYRLLPRHFHFFLCVIPPRFHTYSLIYRLQYTAKLSLLTAFLNKKVSFLLKLLRFLCNYHTDFEIQRNENLKNNVQFKMQTEKLVERLAQNLHKSLYTKWRK
jgi:hypothetical protein